jgi:hypothetical protein
VAQTPLGLESASVCDGHVLVLQMCHVSDRNYSWISQNISQVKMDDTEDVSDTTYGIVSIIPQSVKRLLTIGFTYIHQQKFSPCRLAPGWTAKGS